MTPRLTAEEIERLETMTKGGGIVVKGQTLLILLAAAKENARMREAVAKLVKDRQWKRTLQETDGTEEDLNKACLQVEFDIDDLQAMLEPLS